MEGLPFDVSKFHGTDNADLDFSNLTSSCDHPGAVQYESSVPAFKNVAPSACPDGLQR